MYTVTIQFDDVDDLLLNILGLHLCELPGIATRHDDPEDILMRVRMAVSERYPTATVVEGED